MRSPGETYVLLTAPESTVEYKIGYRHGATGRRAVGARALGNQGNYIAGYAEGYRVRREEISGSIAKPTEGGIT